MKSDTELWKDIPGYEGSYQASTFGNIKSLDRGRFKGRPIIPNIAPNGRQLMRLHKSGKIFTTHLSRVIAITFIPNPENKLTVNHIDGNPLNNRIENLEWATYQENFVHAVETGLIKVKGQNNHFAKLKDDDIPKIRALLQSGKKRSEVAAEYRVSYGTIYGIGKNIYWVKSDDK